MAANPDNECILMQTDIAFDWVLHMLAEMQKRSQVTVRTQQVVTLENIQSASSDEYCQYIFGGEKAQYKMSRINAFTQTASSVLRMCMMRSANMQYMPRFSSMQKNKLNMQYDQFGPKFSLAKGDKVATLKYYSRYDHLYPHFLLAQKYQEALPTCWWTMDGAMMLIFRKNFTELIEFSTTFSAGERPELGVGTFKSFVNVRCIVRELKENGGLTPLQEFTQHSTGQSLLLARESYLGIMPKEEDLPNPTTFEEDVQFGETPKGKGPLSRIHELPPAQEQPPTIIDFMAKLSLDPDLSL